MSAERCVPTVISEYMDAWRKVREYVDTSAEDAVADIRVRAEVVDEGS